MSELGHAESFRDLVVYKNARKLAQLIFELTKSFPKEEMYSLTDQVNGHRVPLEHRLLRHGPRDDIRNIL